MRKYFIDNIRWLCVLFLFPYHTFMVFNSFGESFYVKGANVEITTIFIIAAYPWLMPLLFLVAGISSAYALQKRTSTEYIKERVFKLLIPFVFGVLLLVPVQTYFAEIFHNGYAGNYFEQYILFFTKITDLTGYNGGLTPAHLWFILYLFIISLIALPIMHFYQKSAKKLPVHKITLPVLLPLFLIPGFSQMILDIGGKSLGEYFAWFLLGYFLVSCETLQEKLQKYRFLLLGLSIPCAIIHTFYGEAINDYNFIIYEVLYSFYAWVTILAILGISRKYFNFTNRATAYLSKSSFGIYVLHQQWIVITAYFALKLTDNIQLQMVLITTASTVLTFLNYELFKRIIVTRFAFGLKK